MLQPDTLPAVLAGPLLRRLEPGRLVLWLVGSRALALTLRLQFCQDEGEQSLDIDLDATRCQVIAVGRAAFIHLIDVSLATPLPQDVPIRYDLLIEGGAGIAQWAPHLLYPGAQAPDFILHSRIRQLLHGSCRKPHHYADEGLLCADRLLAADRSLAQRPALLMMSGDQVYADDVAGPMLRAIHGLIARLGLFDEHLDGAVVDDSAKLYDHPASYYHRADLLPALESNETLRERFFGGVKKPIFTSSTADNHLVTFAEVMAMYLLVWSPTPWTLIATQPPTRLTAEERARYAREQVPVDKFRDGLGGVARVFAHVPCLMIFDDHDITDDWNLSAQWEQTAYGHPFSKRIIGNALLAYMLCQGWGNNPDAFAALVEKTLALSATAQQHDNHLPAPAQDQLLEELLQFQQWHYVLPTTPALVVIDTRTRRWRSEFTLKQPSGLLDWEALSELQQELLDHPSAIIVSPAPIFGVKLIETVQKVFSWCGYPLLVDAENWMAHRGAAQVILNIFRHSRTPGNYVILSGDVHYSFVYQVLIRHRNGGPNIWQITSSGIKNQFPPRLLEWFDRLNRWLYSPRSPLNWLTRRRRMQVVPYIPEHAEAGERLWNSAGIGQVFFNEEGQPEAIYQHNANGSAPTRMVEPL
ncbi:alkaline phosphatase family protein [Pseudomonas sp. MF6772]|uniref:alkaline phosphatase D family protein n=1 Tax=Pseudomonas TaxID=286 RepID=UPI0014761C54|nr:MULTISPECIES: alkaline phosphatase D family protein [Pseudomonas]MBJ2271314.1 alkaline phosphatase family protein [Pseudomonas sp. MF6772]MCU0214238.1 alkaline phosphatase family protein [Pseudomonas shahriarae]NMY22958.1 alkaline phosphatase family protein [Pseudomonas sp. WS 5410]